ncbi:MAG: type I DNA topoisomerase [Myxococcota bacterium]|nr:type I DNA topoisomerase [Myxococcota bacterium]
MGKSLLVVESPAKVRTIKRYVGGDYVIKASVGHVRDLPVSKLGVDVKNGFEPEYQVIVRKKGVLREIVQAAREADAVYLAPDPDREGEAIAYHIAQTIDGDGVNVPVHRVLFHEITRKGIERGLAEPRQIDVRKFEAQQARRILDRLVGYELSPILWKKIQRGLSAGRVQSVALRLVVEREIAIRAFVPEEYWHVFATLAPAATAPAGAFRAQLVRIDGAKARVASGAEADETRRGIERARLVVARVDERSRRRNPPPPYVTSRLQQDASARFRFPAKRTMAAAQQLYEGVEIGDGGPTGLITYMRTDSTRVSDSAAAACREFVASRFGPSEVPDRQNVFPSRGGAQDAHEAIRPADVNLTPETVARRLTPDQAKIYGLVWRRFVASQMKPAVYAVTTADIDAQPPDQDAKTLGLRATCSRLAERGWLAVQQEAEDDSTGRDDGGGDPGAQAAAQAQARPQAGRGAKEDPREASDEGCEIASLPPLARGEELALVPPGVATEQKFTQPPPRFTEGSLIRELEELGIGRPSTYATIVSTIQERRYARKDGQKLVPTELGEVVNDRLTRHFPDVINTEFTAKMEGELDRVEEGAVEWRKVLAEFYGPFSAAVERARKEMTSVRGESTPTDQRCPLCAGGLVLRWGRAGRFLACSGYPECKYTRDAPDASGAAGSPLPDLSGEVCDKCGLPMKARRGRFGAFLACTGYPKCKSTRPMPTGVACTREGCGGALVERRTGKGRTFWGCSNRAKNGCEFVSWRRPVPRPCPRCSAPYLVEARSRGSTTIVCDREGCDHREGTTDEHG